VEVLTTVNSKEIQMRSEAIDLPYEIACANSSAQAHYRQMIRDGQGERFAIMCSLQVATGTKGSDRAFMEGRLNNQQLDDMPVNQAQYIAREARGAGISIEGKYYVGGLADGRGWRDPEAWVSSSDEILKVAKKRRRMVQGSVSYDPGPQAPERKAMSERLIKEYVAKERKTDKKTSAADLRAKVVEKHAYKAKGR
jgi:hypothetical protein